MFKRFSTIVFQTMGFLTIAGVVAFQQPVGNQEVAGEPTRFQTGEHLEYRVHYGFLNAAEASIDVSDKFHRVNGRPCYRVVVQGRTTGAFDFVTRIRDSWQSSIDTESLQPQEFFMKQQEGKFQKEQRVSFDQAGDKLICATKEKDSPEDVKELKTPPNIHDVISGYYYLRTVDFSKLKEGQIVGVKAFYDNQFYDLRVRYVGKEVIKTKYGKLNTHKVIPQMPKTDLFDGKEAIRIWVSDDENKLPIKVEFDLAVGAVAMDIKDYKNLKVEPKWF